MLDIVAEQQWAAFVEAQDALRRLSSVPQVLAIAVQMRVGSTPYDVVFEKGTLRLLRYRRETPARWAEPVLICYALINRHYILDLLPDKSVVRRYLDAGFDVYMIDWGVPRDEDSRLCLYDYVCRFLEEVVGIVSTAHDREDVHIVGYCMGGTLATMFAALRPERVCSLTLMAAPLDFGGRETLLSLWTDGRHFDVDGLLARHGNCPAFFLQGCFLLMKPVQNLVEKHLALLDQFDDPRIVEAYFAMEHWVNDNIPVAGETFREFVKSLYQQNLLVKGDLSIGEHRIDLRRIECPVLFLTAKNDHLVAPSSTLGILPHVQSPDTTTMSIDAGHVGLVVGGKAHKGFWPKATAWLVDRSTPSIPSRQD